MAANAKGKRRVKGKTLDLNSFLGNQSAAPGYTVVTPKRDWADYVEEENEMDKYTSYRKNNEKIVLPTAPKAARGPDFDVSKIPSEPPFTAYIGNLPFDITEEEIIRFFGNLSATSVRLPREGGDRGRMKGFGYAEFESKQALIEALSLNGESLKNRPVKVSLAGENEGGRAERKNDGIDRTASDWRAAPKSEDSFSSRNQRNGNTSFNRYEDSDREPYKGRGSYGEDSHKGRYNGSDQGRRSNERDRDFSFGGSERGGYNKRYGDGGFENFDRNRAGYDRGARTERGERRDRDDFDNRRDDRDLAFVRGPRIEKKEHHEQRYDTEQERDRPKERTRLQLKPRTIPVGEQTIITAPAAASSIFGGAKPVDTAAKEREIERRLAKEREKLDEPNKPGFSSREVETRLKNEEFQNFSDESSKEVKLAEDEKLCDESPKTYTCEDEVEHNESSAEQKENGIEFLSNKFAHLRNDED